MSTDQNASRADEARHFYTVAEAARLLRVSTMTVYRAIANDAFPAIKITSRRYSVPAKAIDAMIDAAVTGHCVVDAGDFQVTRRAA
ncbi:helix-turn-helix domain-containing protein [Jiangella rhizosphaerae]|uniref:DNA-binding protein n=1 Tax=Jiangella rhizosphaerae TaxID=2293569 RepID=A0A418KT27_9ACTN|nr:helix-turn-helix domain-containing protein [Jiangella rhizosphaerae]RIQ29140.1 DNA-binding protein [Jiangella rhizosphaerae]